MASRGITARGRLFVAVLLATGLMIAGCSGSGGGDSDATTSATSSGPFAGSPAADWKDASVALVMPPAKAAGPFTVAEVRGALKRAKAYLLAARTSKPVLAHDTSGLVKLVDPHALTGSSSTRIQIKLGATFLAAKNSLAAPVRLAGTVTDKYVAEAGGIAERFVVSANVVWAYALKAKYPVADIPSHVLAIHEHINLSFYMSKDMSGPMAKPDPSSDQTLWYDADCGYFNQRLLALPRVNDPDAEPIANSDPQADQDTAFDPNSDINVSTHTCKPNH